MKRTLFLKIILFSTILNSCLITYSQKNNYVGLIFSCDIRADGENMILNDFPGVNIGISYERKFNNYLGIETGINYKTRPTKLFISEFPTEKIRIIENYVSVPVLIKYYSNIVNISAGGVLDYFIWGYGLEDNPNVNITEYKLTPMYFPGIICKISKDFKISDKLILEPQIKYSGYPPPGDFSYLYGAVTFLTCS